MFCVKCGRKLEEGLNFCTNCGFPINDKIVQTNNNKIVQTENDAAKNCSATTKQGKKEKKHRLGIIIALIFLLAGVSFVAFWSADGKKMIHDVIGKWGYIIEYGKTGEDHQKNTSEIYSETDKNTVEPSVTPINTAEPSITPDNTMEPSTAPVNTVEPSTMPDNTIESSASPVNTINPAVAPTEKPAYDWTTADSPEKALQNYAEFFVYAVNTGNAAGAEHIMKKGSNIYSTQKKMIKNYTKRGLKEELKLCQAMEIYQTANNAVEVVSNERIKVYYPSGTQKVVEQSYIYTCVLTKDGYLLTDMRKNNMSDR